MIANGASQEQLQAERIVHELHEVPLQLAILAGAAADRTRLHVGVVRVAVFDLVVDAGGEPIERALQGRRLFSVTFSSWLAASAE